MRTPTLPAAGSRRRERGAPPDRRGTPRAARRARRPRRSSGPSRRARGRPPGGLLAAHPVPGRHTGSRRPFPGHESRSRRDSARTRRAPAPDRRGRAVPDRSRRPDRDRVGVARDAVEAGAGEQEHATRIERTRRDLRDHDGAATDHRRRGPVAEERGGLGRRRRNEDLRSHGASLRSGPLTTAASRRYPSAWSDALDHDLDVLGAAPLDSASAFVRASIIFGTDSSVTRRSYSLTSIIGTVLPPSARPALSAGTATGIRAV